MRSSSRALAFLTLVGGSLALPVGCSLDGLVFDVPDSPTGGASSSSSGGPSGSSATSSASSGSGAGGDGGGAQGSSSSSSGGPPEDCSNGVDDNMNGLADCDDPGCLQAGYTCFDPTTVPADWTGPLILFDGAGMAPACPSNYPTQHLSGITGPSGAAQCAACSCSAPIVNCTPGPMTGFADDACSLPGGSSFGAPADGICTAVSVQQSTSFVASPPLIATGGCQPAGGAPMNQPVTYNNALGCGDGKGSPCGAGGVCMPPAPSPFGGKLCVAQAADVPCPDPFTQRHGLADINGVSDTRSCSPCECNGLSQASCNATYSLFAKPGCMMKLMDITANGQCVAANLIGAQGLKASVTASGQCAPPAGGTPTGGVSAGTVITVCCLP